MSSGRPGPSGPTASRSTRPATSSSPATRPATSTAATPATRPTTCSSSSSTPTATQKWLRQFGVPGLADRGYAIATDATGNIYVTGYTRGNLAAVNLGDKDIYIAKLDPSGRAALAEAVRERRRGQGLGRRRDRRRHPARRDDVGRARQHARGRARRLGRAVRRRRQPGLAARSSARPPTRRSGA